MASPRDAIDLVNPLFSPQSKVMPLTDGPLLNIMPFTSKLSRSMEAGYSSNDPIQEQVRQQEKVA